MASMEDFPKYEHLCKESEVEFLFKKGVGFSYYPYRVIYLFRPVHDQKPTCRMLVSVSKKRFHHAIKRNRVKRLVREAWRKNKSSLQLLCDRHNISLDVALIYNATVVHSYAEVYNKTRKAVKEIAKRHEFKKDMASD